MTSRILYLVGACAAMAATSCTPGPATRGMAADSGGATPAANSTATEIPANGTATKRLASSEGETNVEEAMFGAGCFWGVEAAFRKVDGVTSTAVGYSGGTLDNPTYKDVCGHGTGHAEVVEVQYDPSKVTYDQLLDVFWNTHDPTTLNRQGPDFGTQYRSAIFYHTPEQKKAAEASKSKLAESGKVKRPIVTEITPAATFWRAEEYHQCYLEKRGSSSCGAH